MTSNNRRDFLRLGAGTVAAAATAQGALAQTIADALAIPANYRTGTLDDVEHIVILMQENRSFDHYFGTLRGVRGFGDPRPMVMPDGKSVWHQPNGSGALLPFHPSAPNLGLQFLQDLPHGWQDTHAAWNLGKYDQWVPSKGSSTMAYLTRHDIPYHYQLADAFTICDAYHCSLLGPTDPNRYYMWSGWVGNDGNGGGPVISNAEAGYDWTTFPEVLEGAGVSWKIYQDVGDGLDRPNNWGWNGNKPYVGNYGDNSLLYFHQYQNAQPGSALYQKARTGTNVQVGGTLFDVLKDDVAHAKLPQVSWIVAPESYTEHPNWPANYGAWYVDQVLKTLISNPQVWSKTVFFITYDENDGFFDHVVPPYAPHDRASGASTISTTDEYFAGNASNVAGPYGLGARVPMLIVSPWTRGGWSCSEVFDHTSLIRFIQRRFGDRYALPEPNITPWRRTVCGDLTSAFDFARPNEPWQRPLHLPDTSGYAPPDRLIHPDYIPVPPTRQALPDQESGVRPARALPYELVVTGRLEADGRTFTIEFANTGRAGASFYVNGAGRSDGPWTYTVEAGRRLSGSWPAQSASQRGYDLSVYGPNGFLCRFAGRFAGVSNANGASRAELSYRYDNVEGDVLTRLTNRGTRTSRLTLSNGYGGHGDSRSHTLQPGASADDHWNLSRSFGWYDISVTDASDDGFVRRIAGHVETGRSSISDPAFSGG